jgi:isochorismate hydrolase
VNPMTSNAPNTAGIAEIPPYPMPTGADLPVNRVGWRPDRDRAALLVHDMQRYFVDFLPADRSPTTELVANVAALRRRAAALGVPVIYTAQPGAMSRTERGLLHDMWGAGMGADPAARQILAEVAPTADDLVLTKWRYSAFHRSPLRSFLADRGRDQLVVCGVYAHVGVLATAMDAFSADIETFLVADAVADFSPEEHSMALRYAAGRCAVVLTTSGLLTAFDETQAGSPSGTGIR